MRLSDPVPLLARLRRPWWRTLLHWLLLAAVTAVYLWAHLRLGHALADQTNQDPLRSDQENNMRCARSAAARAPMQLAKGFRTNLRDWLPHYTDGVVNPLWPRLAATFASADDRQFFNDGKRWNVAFGAVFLGACALWLGRRWAVPAVLVFLLAAGLGAVIPRSPWFQPEPVYYALFFASFVTSLAILKSNPVWRYALLGLLTGLAYLAKASVQPLLLVFFGVTALRFLGAVWPHGGKAGPRTRSEWNPSSHFIGLSVLLAVHLVVISPRLGYSQQAFGHPLHAYPSSWMWLDDFEQGYAWMGTHNTREQLAAIAPEDKPSARRWLETHSREEGWRRLADGTWWQVRRLVASDPTPRAKDGSPKKPWQAMLEYPGWTLVALAGLGLVAAAGAIVYQRREKLPVHRQQPERGMMALFVLGTVACYSLLHGWYTPVGDGDRFMLALFPPLVFSLLAAGEDIVRRLQARALPPGFAAAYRAGQWLLAGWLGWRMAELLLHPRFA